MRRISRHLAVHPRSADVSILLKARVERLFMAWYAYCITEKQAFPELIRHRKPIPMEAAALTELIAPERSWANTRLQ